MSLYRRCTCAKEGRVDCAHPWWFKFKYRGGTIRESTDQTNQRKAALVELRRHAEVVDTGTGIAKKKAIRLKAHLEDYLTWARNDHPRTADERDARILVPRPSSDPTAPPDKRKVRERGPSFLEVVGDKPLDQITAFDIERWRTSRLKTPIYGGGTVGRSTVNRDLAVVSGCFTMAVEWKRLRVSPVAEVAPWETDETPVRVLTAAERVIVLTQLPPLLAMVCRVTLEALLRISEVLRLRREDLGASSLQRRLKGGKVRTIPVTPSLVADLRRWLTTPEQESVFGDPPPNSRSVSALLTEAFRAVGLHGISHHVMRHTGVTDMLEDGVSDRAIMEYAGWSSLRMLQRYGHVRDAELQRATAGTAARNHAAVAQAARQAATMGDGTGQGGTRKKGAQKGAHGE